MARSGLLMARHLIIYTAPNLYPGVTADETIIPSQAATTAACYHESRWLPCHLIALIRVVVVPTTQSEHRLVQIHLPDTISAKPGDRLLIYTTCFLVIIKDEAIPGVK